MYKNEEERLRHVAYAQWRETPEFKRLSQASSLARQGVQAADRAVKAGLARHADDLLLTLWEENEISHHVVLIDLSPAQLRVLQVLPLFNPGLFDQYLFGPRFQELPAGTPLRSLYPSAPLRIAEWRSFQHTDPWWRPAALWVVPIGWIAAMVGVTLMMHWSSVWLLLILPLAVLTGQLSVSALLAKWEKRFDLWDSPEVKLKAWTNLRSRGQPNLRVVLRRWAGQHSENSAR